MFPRPLFNKFWRLANKMRRDIEYDMNGVLKSFKAMEHLPPKIDANTYYKMTIMTDDNGHVKLKTITKEPGRDFEVREEEFNRGEKQTIKNLGKDEKATQQAIGSKGEEKKATQETVSSAKGSEAKTSQQAQK